MENNDNKQYRTIKKFQPWLEQYRDEYLELMAYYRCAMMEVETKFKVLNEEYSLRDERNPIDSIKCRLKTPESIFDKIERRGYELSIESIERNLDDVAGIRLICKCPSDIYMLCDALLRQDDVILVEMKDYVKEPKANGYRSLHLIIALPIFLHDHKKIMTVEIQFRTIAMDWWATLEHEIRYKKNIKDDSEIGKRLLACAETCFEIDTEIERIYVDSLKKRV